MHPSQDAAEAQMHCLASHLNAPPVSDARRTLAWALLNLTKYCWAHAACSELKCFMACEASDTFCGSACSNCSTSLALALH